jgi:putative ABC transport system permease protein
MKSLPVSPAILISLAVVIGLFITLVLIGKVPLGYNVRNLLVRWRITLMTALAFTLVVSLLTVMLAFVNGMNHITESSGQPGNVIILSDGATDELFSNLQYSDTGNVDRQKGVLQQEFERDGKKVTLPLCSREVYIVVNQPIPGEVGGSNRRRFVQVRGIDDALVSSAVHGIDLLPNSKWFSEAGVEGETIQAVLGEGVARVLGADLKKPGLEVGDRFDLGDRKWIVTGLMKSAGSTVASEIWAKRSIVGPQFGKEQITCLVARTADAKAAAALADDLSTNFKPAVRAEPESVYYSKLSETNNQFLYAIVIVAFFMALGGICGVMNTMFAAISQRTKDIGILRIIGFAKWQILVSFFLETMFIAVVGGLVGCLLGYLCNGLTATSVVSSGQGGGGKTVVLKLVVDANTIAFGILFTLVMGALGGLVPSLLSAMRMRPLESLR